MRTELEKFLADVKKPLDFASRNDFSRLSRIPSLEKDVRNICTRALAGELPAKARSLVSSLRESFSGFGEMETAEKKRKISSAKKMLGRIGSLEAGRPRREGPPPRSAAEKSDAAARKPGAKRGDVFSAGVGAVGGVGPKVASYLAKRSVRTVYDLLFYSPRKYDDRREITEISEILPGSSYTLRGKVASVGEIRVRNSARRFFQATLSDGHGKLRIVWFNYHARYLRGIFRKGAEIIVHGRISLAQNSRALQMIHPLPQDVEVVEEGEGDGENSLQFGRILPVYPLTEGLTQKRLRETVKKTLGEHAGEFRDLIPPGVSERHGLMDLAEALGEVHFPGGDGPMVDFGDAESVMSSRAHRTVVFFEFFILQLGLLSKKRKVERSRGISFRRECAMAEELLRSLPFSLTSAQERAVSAVADDMASPRPMNRLLQGDVGSGKTLVATVSMLRAVESGYQAALMAPTEILAEQHFRNVERMTSGMDVGVRLLKSDLSRARKESVCADIAAGRADIVVGTHSLISEAVEFKALGFAVIDEQHRFGVLQRAGLVRKGEAPDVLVMTATPIPRTLAITVYGDLEVSVIDELPPSRKKVRTFVLRDTGRNRSFLYDSVREELSKGRQAYFVYPFIEESENPDFKNVRHVTAMVGELREEFPDYRVGLLHGRMKSEERDGVMEGFAAGERDILVSTTVIEVGVDVPNATVMVIENAERFGLSQLHQMRGRVGRGEHESTCFILCSRASGEESEERLRIMGETTDGFRISEADLANRGPRGVHGNEAVRRSRLQFRQPGQGFLHTGRIEGSRRRARRRAGTGPRVRKTHAPRDGQVGRHAGSGHQLVAFRGAPRLQVPRPNPNDLT